jgi:hypothetical protein
MKDSKKIFRNYLEEMREGCERKGFAGLGPQLHALLVCPNPGDDEGSGEK